MSDARNEERLVEWLSDWVGESVRFEALESHAIGDMNLYVVDMTYTQSTSDGDGHRSTRTIKQTGVVYFDERFDLPSFTVTPTTAGIARALLSMLGAPDINFDDTPEFSRRFQVIGYVESAVRILLTHELRQYLESIPKVSVAGNGKHLVVYRREHLCDSQEREQLVQHAVRMIEMFWQAHDGLDQRTDVHRETRPEDALDFAEKMGGIAGAALRRQLLQLKLTRREVEDFLSQTPPRRIPIGLHRQVLGQSIVFVFMGAFFVLMGCLVFALTLALPNSIPVWIGIPGGVFTSLIGFAIGGFATSYRGRLKRTLQAGEIASATITDIKRTDVTVNNERRYLLKLRLDNGESVSVSIYGEAAERAKRKRDGGQRVRLLLDPKNRKLGGICVDLLLIWDD